MIVWWLTYGNPQHTVNGILFSITCRRGLQVWCMLSRMNMWWLWRNCCLPELMPLQRTGYGLDLVLIQVNKLTQKGSLFPYTHHFYTCTSLTLTPVDRAAAQWMIWPQTKGIGTSLTCSADRQLCPIPMWVIGRGGGWESFPGLYIIEAVWGSSDLC